MIEVLGSAVRVAVRAEGAIDAATRAYGRDKIARVVRIAPAPILAARLDLALEHNPSIERRATAKASLDVNGRIVRAHVAASTPREAIDIVERRLHARLLRMTRPAATHARRTPDRTPLHRPAYRELDAAARSVVRFKRVTLRAMTPEEAAAEAELRDYAWYLFVDHDLGIDALVERGDPASEIVADPASNAHGLREAAQRLDAGPEPFAMFVDATTRRAGVLYRRFDGNYGIVQAT